MRKIGCILVVISVFITSFLLINNFIAEEKAESDARDYISDTSNKRINDLENFNEEKNNEIKYTAVLEIPHIALKRGVVDSTKGFKSINYAISVDNNSQYPSNFGNFILYAHSGNTGIAYFNRLSQVEIGDDINVYYNGIKYNYKVNNKYKIKKTGQLNLTIPNDNKYVSLITCDMKNRIYQIVVTGIIEEESKY